MNIFKFSLMVLFKPMDAFPLIKAERDKFSYRPAIILLLMMIMVRIVYIYIVHYPLADILPRDASIWLEIVKYLLPVLTWVLACYAVTTIISGESMMREIFMASAYAMLPYIVFTLPIGLLSHLLGDGETGIYAVLQKAIWLWVFILIFISVMTMNSYEFWQTVGICVLSVIAMILIWGIAGLFFALGNQLYRFIYDIAIELRMLRS